MKAKFITGLNSHGGKELFKTKNKTGVKEDLFQLIRNKHGLEIRRRFVTIRGVISGDKWGAWGQILSLGLRWSWISVQKR